MALRISPAFLLICAQMFAQRGYWPPDIRPQSGSNYTLNSTTPKRAQCVMVFSNIETDGVIFGLGSVTTGDTLTISIQTTNASGLPSGTVLASASISVTTGMANSEQSVTFNQSVSLPRNTLYCVVFELPESPTGNFGLSMYNYISAYKPFVMVHEYSSGAWSTPNANVSPRIVFTKGSKMLRQFLGTDYWENLSRSANVEYGTECISEVPWKIVGLRVTGGAVFQVNPETTLRVYVNGVLKGSSVVPAQPISVNGPTEMDALLPTPVVVGAGNSVTLSFQASSGQQIGTRRWLVQSRPPWLQHLGMSGMTACKSGQVSNGRVTTPDDRRIYNLGFFHEGAVQMSGGFVIQQ